MTPSAAMQVEFVPRASYYVTPEEFIDLGGSYALDNGAHMKFTRHQNKYFAEVDGVEQTEVFPVAQNVFVAKDNKIKMAFQPDDSGFTTYVTMRYEIVK